MRNLVSNSFVWIGAALGVVGVTGVAADLLIAGGQSFWLVEHLAAISAIDTIGTAAASAAVGGISSKTKGIDTSSTGSKRNVDSPERSHEDQKIAIEQERFANSAKKFG